MIVNARRLSHPSSLLTNSYPVKHRMTRPELLGERLLKTLERVIAKSIDSPHEIARSKDLSARRSHPAISTGRTLRTSRNTASFQSANSKLYGTTALNEITVSLVNRIQKPTGLESKRAGNDVRDFVTAHTRKNVC